MTKEYVRKNEIYTTVNGEIIRITPDMIKKIIRNGVVTEVYFSEVESKKVYDEYMRSVWREEKALEREDRCMVSNGKGKIVRCTGNCASCEHRNENSMLSIETAEENGSLNIEDKNARPDAIAEDVELLKALWERIDELCDEDQTIIKMFGEGFTESKIADAIGMSQPAVNYRKKKILKELKKNLEFFL